MMDNLPELPVWVEMLTLALLSSAMLLALIRLYRGPSPADRIVALDLIASVTLCFALAFAVISGVSRYLDIAAIVALVTFIGTVAYATYLKKRYND